VRSVAALGDRDEGRSDDPIAQAIAPADLFHDLAVGPAGARDVGDRIVLPRIERPAGRRVDCGHALALEQGPQLAVDRCDTADPGVVGDLGWPGIDRQVEVVGDGQDLADQDHAGQPEVALTLLGRPAPEAVSYTQQTQPTIRLV
jgi:hypothetical protein